MNVTSFYLVALTIVAADQGTKLAVQQWLRLGQIVPVIPSFFNLTYVLNPGAAFGFLSDAPAAIRHPLFMAISVGAVLFIIYYQARHHRMGRLPSLGLACVLGGAVGNLIDRVRVGMVVDFLDFYYGTYHWPAFNIADSAITIGVGALLIDMLFEPGRR